MPDLGKKYTCYSCHTKFYDLGKPVPTCPKCGADQRDSEDTPVVTTGRGRRVVEEPIDEAEFSGDSEGAATPAASDDEEEETFPDAEREEEADEEEHEEY